MKLVFLIFILSAVSATEMRANPIRRVVTMMQNMQKKVEAEGEKEKELYEKFMCYCKNADGTLGKSIEEANGKIPQLEAAIKEAVAKKAQLTEDLVGHKSDRAQAIEAIATAEKMRAKDAESFAKEAAENSSNIKSLGRAVEAISKGLAGFLQNATAVSSLKALISTSNLSPDDHDEVMAFLENKEAGGAGEILGILKTMKEQMEKDLADATAGEDASKKEFAALGASKQKEVAAASRAIEKKTSRAGEVAVELVNIQNDLEDTQDALNEDQKFLAELDTNCAKKTKEWEQRQVLRSQELSALADTVKVLNDDDALDLFNKTAAKNVSLLQLDDSAKELRSQALSLVQEMRSSHSSTNLDLISLALRGKKVGFEKVLKMIDDMVVLLKKEQVDDDNKKDYCVKELDSAEDKHKEVTRDISDLKGNIAEYKDTISQLDVEIKALQEGLESLAKGVAEAGSQRKSEHEEFVELQTGNMQAMQLLEFAKNRLNKFYNPRLYKAPPKRELSEEERLFVAGGGELEPTPAPGGIAGTGIGFVQIRSHMHSKFLDAQAPPPDTFGGEYKKKGGDSSGVIALIDTFINDLRKETQTAEFEEKESQKDYDQMLADSREKQEADGASIVEKQGASADAQETLQGYKDGKRAKEGELAATNELLHSLHSDCDFLAQNYDQRKEARSNEIDGLGKAKSVLSGADYSFLQFGRYVLV